MSKEKSVPRLNSVSKRSWIPGNKYKKKIASQPVRATHSISNNEIEGKRWRSERIRIKTCKYIIHMCKYK